MHLIPKDAMASKLDPAWAFLSGEDRHFEEGVLQDTRPGELEHAVVLQVHFPENQKTCLMAVSLLIEDSEAQAVACFMFGVAPEDIQPDDIRDACMEACNVLGGCLVQSDDDQHTVEIGLPQEVSLSRFSELRQHAHECVTFCSDTPDGRRVVLTVFDSVEHGILES